MPLIFGTISFVFIHAGFLVDDHENESPEFGSHHYRYDSQDGLLRLVRVTTGTIHRMGAWFNFESERCELRHCLDQLMTDISLPLSVPCTKTNVKTPRSNEMS